MTPTEAKALALELRGHACKFYSNMAQSNLWSALIAAADYIETAEATEARHAAEMREFKGRFSEVAGRAVQHLDLTYYNKGSPSQLEREAIVAGLKDFIIPAPDPLAEALKEADAPAMGKDGYDAMAERTRAAMQARGYEWRKIGEAGE